MTRRLIACVLIVLVPGCGWVFDWPFVTETGSPQLKAFSSKEELAAYLSDQIGSRNDGFATFDDVAALSAEDASGGTGGDVGSTGVDAAPPAAGDGDGAVATNGEANDDGFSQTTIQEEGVDESDVIKTDGTYLYMLDDGAGGSSVLRIVRVTPRESMAVVSETPIEGYGRDIYLHGDKVIALTYTGGGYYYFGGGGVAIDVVDVAVDSVAVGDAVASQEIPAPDDGSTSGAGSTGSGSATVDMPPSDAVVDDSGGEAEGVGDDRTDEGVSIEPDLIAPDFRYERPRTMVTVVDVTLRESPAVLTALKLDGTQSASRLIDGVLHVVLSNYETYYYDVMPMLGRAELTTAIPDVDELMPMFEREDGADGSSSGSLVTWEGLYHPTDPDGFGMVTVASIDIDNGASVSAVGVVAEPGMIYSSREALYLTDTNYDFRGGLRETTDIYKLAYVDRGSQPVAAGVVPGRVLNQYSMGEYEGHLRVATTIGRTFSFNGISVEASNSVYVLGDVDGTLATMGSVEGIAPRETIQSARFIGDRGYVVTFENTDPLFTLDLSDPRDPRVIGELEVPGFSTFIVPMDADHLLTVGQYVPPPGEFGNWGVQVSIFDVTDFANPVRQSNYIVGDDTGAYSEAIWNPKAFTYYAASGMVALPLSVYDNLVFLDDVAIGVEGEASGGASDGDATDAAPPPDEAGADGDSSSGSDGSAGDQDVAIDEPVDSIEPYVPQGFEGVLVLKATVADGLAEMGRISSRFEEAGYYWASFTRGVFIGDDVMAVTNHGLRGAPANTVEPTTFELLYSSAAESKPQ